MVDNFYFLLVSFSVKGHEKVHLFLPLIDFVSCIGCCFTGFTEPVQDRLHEANMTVYSDAACKSNHGDVINRGHVCAGSSGVAACDVRACHLRIYKIIL